MSDTDPEILFEEMSLVVDEDEAEADCGEVPAELIELSVELQAKDVSPAEFMDAYGARAARAKPKKAAKKR